MASTKRKCCCLDSLEERDQKRCRSTKEHAKVHVRYTIGLNRQVGAAIDQARQDVGVIATPTPKMASLLEPVPEDATTLIAAFREKYRKSRFLPFATPGSRGADYSLDKLPSILGARHVPVVVLLSCRSTEATISDLKRHYRPDRERQLVVVCKSKGECMESLKFRHAMSWALTGAARMSDEKQSFESEQDFASLVQLWENLPQEKYIDKPTCIVFANDRHEPFVFGGQVPTALPVSGSGSGQVEVVKGRPKCVGKQDGSLCNKGVRKYSSPHKHKCSKCQVIWREIIEYIELN